MEPEEDDLEESSSNDNLLVNPDLLVEVSQFKTMLKSPVAAVISIN